MPADRWRQAKPHEALEVLLARHRENFSPAEVREVEQAILALREAEDQRVTAAHELPAVKAPTALASSDPEGHLQAMSDAELPAPAAPNMVLVPREPKRGLLCGDVAISTDPRYAGWVFVRHVDGENWTTGAKLTPETWAMLVAIVEARNAT